MNIEVSLLGPLKTEWHALHTECRAPELFVDEQEKGPFAYWRHEHRFAREGEGTRLTDAIKYRLPGGKLINYLGAPFVRWQLQTMFNYRHAITKKSCE